MHYDPHAMAFADQRLRQFLLALLAAGLIGLGVELVLLEHYEDVWQLAPLVLITANLAVLLWQVAKPSWSAVQSLRVLMVAMLAAGAIGVVLHYRANMEFQVEMSPGLGGLELFLKTIRAKVPPPLAPGAMAQLGLLGLLYTYRHPLLIRPHDFGAGQ
jgi:hypothetical protein